MSASVNRPTNIKQKEEDVNRKLQFYGIATAFQNGKVPSNEQIDIALNSFLKINAITNPSTKLSAEGQGLVKDFRDVVEQAKYLLLTKNEGNILQDFIWQSQHIDGANATLPGAPVDGETARQHGNQALEGLRTLGTLVITNGQFRKLLNDATILLRDMAGDAATKAASKVSPGQDQLAQIDHPADDNVWHDTPDISTGNIKGQLRSAVSKNTSLDKENVKAAAGDASHAASGSRDPGDTAKLAQSQGTSEVDAQAGLRAGASSLKQQVSENTSDDTKDKAREVKDTTQQRTKNYLSSKMPEERRDQTIWRLKKMVVEIQGHPDYQQAITTLLELAETYGGHANTLTQNGTGTVKGAHEDSALKAAEVDLKTLIERFANNTSTDDLWDSINTIYRDADQDPELKNWFKQVDKYIRKCLKEQGYIMEDTANDEWNRLYDKGNYLLRDRYRGHTDRILDEIKFIGDQFDKDPLNKKFGQSCQKLFNDLGNDQNGKPTFKPHLVKDLTEVILPSIFESVRYVPVPRIEYADPMIDAVIENLVIESDNLMPNIFEFANDNFWRFGRKSVANKNKNSATISVSGVQMDLRDVSYYVNKKQGFPSIKDQGVADIFLGGTGLSFKIKMSTVDKSDKQNFFKVDKVDVDVKNFNIKLKKSGHKALFGLFKPLMLKVMRPALQKVLEKIIKEKVHELDGLLYKIKLEADRASQEVANDPENAPNVYSRYVSAAQKQFMQGKKKAEDVTADKKVNVAITQHDSIFPNIHLPGGISSKATEYKELAMKGQKWESPIFKLGSASTSNDIPKVGSVTRKSPVANGSNNHVTNGHVSNGTVTANQPAFSTQVDNAFGTEKRGTQEGTTLGPSNPVLTGSA
ncbi:hypothetical protein B7494_g2058 [Chlorociboria aeruginascens]|nr:hypothetical protein B7494_g2058 [Chlorociboria aeruginascens]